MGLFSLITAPVTGPIAGLLWVAEVVQEEAEREYHNIEKIRQHLAETEARIQRGELSEEEGDEIAGQWVERLIQAQQYHSSREK